MRHHVVIVLLTLLTLAASAATTQDSDISRQERRVVYKVAPVYPELAKRMQIAGVVKLRATVAPRGSVKSIEPVGGARC